VRAVLPVPLEFAFRWATDFTSRDARYEGAHYRRRILRRAARTVVYEDLESAPDGWHWARHVVDLHPPDRWHSESVGSHREISLDYRLARLGGNRTQLTLRARRRPSGVGAPNPPKAEWERAIAANWRRFGREMARDYRAARGRRRT
jgi:hypothetical protein